MANEMGTVPVRLDETVVQMVRDHKKATGFPIQRFIEDSIVEKIGRLPEPTQEKMGLVKIKKGKKK